jgi:hypothetical protein
LKYLDDARKKAQHCHRKVNIAALETGPPAPSTVYVHLSIS